jgi:hypothetical protein
MVFRFFILFLTLLLFLGAAAPPEAAGCQDAEMHQNLVRI